MENRNPRKAKVAITQPKKVKLSKFEIEMIRDRNTYNECLLLTSY